MGRQMWIVTPVYRDVESYLELRRRLLAIAAADTTLRSIPIRFVALDDTGGLDGEFETLRKLHDVTVVDPPFNLGHQRGIVYTLRSVAHAIRTTDIVVTLDADGEDRPEDLPRLLAPLLDDESATRKVVLARRTQRKESLAFKGCYLLFRGIFRLVTGTTVRSGNYAAYRGWIAKEVLNHPYFDLSYASTLTGLGLDVEHVPCARGARYAGQSRMSFSKLVMHGLGMLMPYTDRIAIRALLMFSATIVVGLAGSAAVLGVRLFTHSAVPGWATYTLLMLLLLSFVALGHFVVLFTVFSQSRGMSLSDAHQGRRVVFAAPRFSRRQPEVLSPPDPVARPAQSAATGERR